MCAKKKTGQKGSGARADVALVRIEQQRAGGTTRSDAENHKTIETTLTIPPELEPVFQLLENCANEFARHRESLPEESGRRLMENLYPEKMQTIDGFYSLIESEIDQRQMTSPMSILEQAKTYAISFLRQLDFEIGFIAAVERYKADLVNSAKYQKDMEEREKVKKKAKEGRAEQGEEEKRQRNEAVYKAICILFKEGEEVLYKNYRSRSVSKKELLGTEELFSESTFRRALNDLQAQGRLGETYKLVGLPQK
jgi:hypothetical protein